MQTFKKGTFKTVEAEPDSGHFTTVQVQVVHRYVVEQEAVVEEQVIREYPNGGKDVALVTIQPEVGHWETVDADGKVVPCDTVIPNDWGHGDIASVWEYVEFEPFTDAELKEREVLKATAEAEAKAAQEKADAQEALLDALPETQSDTDDAICALYEQIEAQQAIIDSQDDAICALYEMIGETNDQQ